MSVTISAVGSTREFGQKIVPGGYQTPLPAQSPVKTPRVVEVVRPNPAALEAALAVLDDELATLFKLMADERKLSEAHTANEERLKVIQNLEIDEEDPDAVKLFRKQREDFLDAEADLALHKQKKSKLEKKIDTQKLLVLSVGEQAQKQFRALYALGWSKLLQEGKDKVEALLDRWTPDRANLGAHYIPLKEFETTQFLRAYVQENADVRIGRYRNLRPQAEKMLSMFRPEWAVQE
jgi:hypothetical protein